ncbi:MAG: DUF971 domain-containing protein [Gammaproteobacteria bacterium]|nr:DUF971 domain-containing protein [Gammaproteobacteria bacterium]
MTTQPTEIILHKISRTLEVKWQDNTVFVLPFDYLRFHSPSAESRFPGARDEKNKIRFRDVNILSVEPVGNYAVRLIFSDGHRSGIYSWETLFTLGKQYESSH